uniref:Uncharacterized protein n=1 Tax=Abalone asfa-like virus TaxID=2839893 RepID=A0A5K7XX64_9VIRU|nr:hypothetical protein [Abalone asfa-like virus]BCY04565.1 hypothetical protein [Abalone asfa-like virus]
MEQQVRQLVYKYHFLLQEKLPNKKIDLFATINLVNHIGFVILTLDSLGPYVGKVFGKIRGENEIKDLFSGFPLPEKAISTNHFEFMEYLRIHHLKTRQDWCWVSESCDLLIDKIIDRLTELQINDIDDIIMYTICTWALADESWFVPENFKKWNKTILETN